MLQMTAQDRAAWAADITMGLMPREEYWNAMRRAGLTDKTNDELDDAANEIEGL